MVVPNATLQARLELVSQSPLPRCQFQASRRWLEQRQRELLPVPYFHVVFTIPDLLNPFALADPRLFTRSCSVPSVRRCSVIGRDPRHLGVVLGFLAVLHTWGQTLTLHPHLALRGPGLRLFGF